MTISIEFTDGLAVIGLNAASRGFAPTDIVALHQALLRFEADDNASVAILHGGSHFWKGLDAKALEIAFADMHDLKGKLRHFTFPFTQDALSAAPAWTRLFRWRTTKPVIAAIEGDCFDHGLVLLGVHTDLRIAGQSARFGLPAITRGDAAGEALVSRLGEQMAPACLNWMVETAEPIDAAAAHRAWLINEVVEDGAALDRARALAGSMREIPAQRLRSEKLGARYSSSLEQNDAIMLAGLIEAGR